MKRHRVQELGCAREENRRLALLRERKVPLPAPVSAGEADSPVAAGRRDAAQGSRSSKRATW